MRFSSTVILALPMLVGGFVQFVISQYYQKFATDALLLDAAAIGEIFFISRVTDAVLDPLCGYFSDRWRVRRSFIFAGIFALIAGMGVAFLPAIFPATTSRALLYVCASAGIFTVYLGVTLVYIPHYAWISELQREHSKLPFFASRAVTENFGTILGGLSLAFMVPYQTTGGAGLLLFVVAVTLGLGFLGGFPLIGYRDTVRKTAKAHSFKAALQALVRNRGFATVAAMSFFNQFAATTLLGVALFYTDYVLNNKTTGATIAVVFLLSATAGVALWSALSRKFDRYRLWQIALLVIVVSFPTLFIVEHGQQWYLTVFGIIVGGAAGAVILFVPQEVSLLTGSEDSEEGLFFAAFTFVNKSAMACAPLVIGFGLKLAGYLPQSRDVRVSHTISFLFIGLPALAFAISLALLVYYRRRFVPRPTS